MSPAKTLFLRKEPEGKQSVSQWWTSVVRDDRFDLVAVCAQAEMFELGASQDQMRGAAVMLDLLKSLSDTAASPTRYPNPGLHHRMPTKPSPDQPEQKA